ncbi:D-2-hydroxyacid dehydrogenase family protein [Jiangella asiatica]|uniref:D-2-hydroxyacid dehydrogenase family protein n=1 Tax=Jiangella asiatica TaxID=2530372 RepID=A0A4R5D9D7_9ACTN|nr:D-2-hydroxyacid dehydrogenase family protein [Jiangella asiatica]TDE08024.1 D-2-hydroxyacid dehydrogenase family protein [Jiangella asiatica]
MGEHVAILNDYQHVALESADWSGVQNRAELTVHHDPFTSGDQLAGRLAGASVVVAMRERTAFRREVLERLPALRLLVTTGMRNASIDMEAARELGITVCGTGSGGYATAELTWGLILGLLRHIPAEHQAITEGRWQTRIGDTVRGKTLGIVGLGRLGSSVAQVGLAMGMRVIAWSHNLTEERAQECGARRAGSLTELFEHSHVISIHTVSSKRTRGMIDADVLARMRPDAILVNTSRAQIVDQQALLMMLESRAIRGAALDVFETEPLPANSRFTRLDNVILTPHIGHVTRDNYAVFYGDAVEDIFAFWAGAPVRVLN